MPGSYLVVGPDWKGEKPAGIKQVFSSTTPFVFANFRTQLINAEDMPNVEKVQAGYKVQPLSAFLKQPAPPASPKIDFLPATTQGSRTTSSTISMPPSIRAAAREDDRAIRAKLATHWYRPGQDLRVQGPSDRAQSRKSALA